MPELIVGPLGSSTGCRVDPTPTTPAVSVVDRGGPAKPAQPRPAPRRPLNLNHYATKKSVAEGVLDAALLLSNAARLKAVLEQGPASAHCAALLALLGASLLLQLALGVLLALIARLNLNEVGNQWRLNQLNNAATTLVFITVVVNIFITAFGAHKTGFLAARASRAPV
ncbi:ninjurin-2 [Dipodomys spectabilis]|uniref:ninjurin-2 n=1 Tax=Dipodomys spectabilis TaxID=105255 RepID=UPI001C547734|nr:ninjurin-2 [Dipodomys spectabilis]